MNSYALHGFLSRSNKNGRLIRTMGTPVGYSSLSLENNQQNTVTLDESLNINFEQNFTFISQVLKTSLSELNNNTNKNTVVNELYNQFLNKTDSRNIKLIWVENHSCLVEPVKDPLPTFVHSLVRSQNTTNNTPSFLVDISIFLNQTNRTLLESNQQLLSVLYQLGLLRAIASFMNHSDKESFHITLSLLDGKQNNESTSLRTIISNFLENNSSLFHLDHDQTFSHCLREIEEACKQLPASIRNKNVFELEILFSNEKDKQLRGLIKTNLAKRDRQIVLLIKQMDISLPYPRQEFAKSYQHYDIKVRRELCFQLIKNFDRSTESLNVTSVVSRLKESAKYSVNQPKLVCGRESRAFGNQAYLFANSKLIDINTEMLNKTNELKTLCQTEKLKQLINEQFNQEEVASLNHELNDLLNQFLNKFDAFMFELVPSIGRLISLVFNKSKSSSFTQYNGVFQNLREALEIFLRKSSSEVEKQRKKYVEDFFESSTRSGSLTQHRQTSSSFFANVLNALSLYAGKAGQIEKLILSIEESVHDLYSTSTGSVRAAFSVLLQRPSFAGSERFKLNELEIKPEQEESLQKLVTIGGDHLYMSPSYEWIAEATDLIEAVPLFIYERTVIINDKPTTVFEVDQEGLEQTIRQIAEFWAQNIDLTIESEHITLARSILVRLNTDLSLLAAKLEIYETEQINKEICELIALESLIENNQVTRDQLAVRVAKLATEIASLYNEYCIEVENHVEHAWAAKDFITRIEALEHVLNEKKLINLQLLDKAANLPETNETKQLALKAFNRQRPLPAFHLLTTEAPGLVEGFITVVLEEEMAMRNVIKSFGLEDQVKQLCSNVQKKLAIIGDKVITEFGYDPIVSQNMSTGLSKEQSVLRVMGENIPIEEQVAKIAILLQMYYYETNDDETKNISMPFSQVDTQILDTIEAYWSNKIESDSDSIQQEAFKQVWEKNQTDYDFHEAYQKHTHNKVASTSTRSEQNLIIDFLTHDPIYSEEVKSCQKWIIRAKAFEHLCSVYPDLHLEQRLKSFIREHSALVQTTCRRHVISQNGLHAQLCHPKYAYSSGVTFDDNNHFTSSTPSGLRKRYHLIYAPSRVNLGKDERKSVENWSQFLGVSDSLAARHAQQCYELINYSPVIRNIREAENLKVSENQWTALVRSVRNVHAFFVERLGVGDIEDLSYQFNQRGGINLGSLKEGEGYNSGPTAGYCIPKDLLFKLFVGTHQDSRKLLQIGVPKFLHKHLISLMVEVYSHKNKFATIGEWELWAADEFLNKESLTKRFENNQELANQIGGYLENYIKLSGSQIIFHLTKLIQILGNTGVPSPLLSAGRDLHSVLWSNWSDHKITLGGEQVNRATVFTLTREIPESARRSRLLNPKAGIVEEDAIRVVMNGVYKGDDDEPPPPDVRYSWTMRAFQILSGHYQAVADSLDLEGQVIARLSWCGFRPNSTDPRDIETTEYVLKKFNENEITYSEFKEMMKEEENNHYLVQLVERLKKAFPCHSTVGDITMTAVHGVDSEDLLGFSAETLTLLGDEADRVKQILETHGHMSVDQMQANAILRRKFPEEWTPLNQLSLNEQQNIKELVGASYHPLVLRLRGPGTNFISDLQAQDVVVFSITHPEILKLDPAHLRDLMIVGRPNSALCVLDYVAQGRHRCWFERDVMLWYAACRGLTIKGKLSLDWQRRNDLGRQSVYKAFGTGVEQYSPSLGTDLRSEVARQEKRAIEIWQAAKHLVEKTNNESRDTYQHVLVHHLASHLLLSEALYYQQYSQKILMSKRFKTRDKIIQESVQKLTTTARSQLASEFTPVDWLSVGGIFLINGTPKEYQTEILNVIAQANQIITSHKTDINQKDLIEKLIVTQLQPTRMTLGEKKGEMFSVKASEDSHSRAVTRRAQLSIQADLQLSMKYRTKGFEKVQTTTATTSTSIFDQAKQIMTKLANTPTNGYSVEFVNEQFGLITKLTLIALENILNKFLSTKNGDLSKEDVQFKENMSNAISLLYNNGSIDLKVLDSFCGTYEDHGYIARLLEFSKQQQQQQQTTNVNESIEEILSVNELLYFILALEKTSSFLTNRFSVNDPDSASNLWRKLSEFFAKTIDDHFYEYNPWILDSKRGSAFVHYYDDLGMIKSEYKHALYSTSWLHHRILYKYFNNLILNHSELPFKVPNENDRNHLIGLVKFDDDLSQNDSVVITAIGNTGVGEEDNENNKNKNYESLWRSYNQLREIAFMRNDGFEFPVVFTQLDAKLINGLNTSEKINLAILSPIGRTHYSRAIMESDGLNDNVFITRTGYFSDTTSTTKTNKITKEKTFLFIQDAHFFLNKSQYHASLKHHFGINDQEADQQIETDIKLNRFTEGKGIRVAASFKEPVLIGCCIAHHHHPLEIGLTEAGYPATDKSPFLFDLTYNKSLYPVMYAAKSSQDLVLLPPQIDWFKEETTLNLNEQLNKYNKTYQQAEEYIIHLIKQRLRPFALEHGILIAKGAAESGARNLNRFDIRNLSGVADNNSHNDLLDESVLTEAAKFIYQVSKGQNVTIQRAIVSTPLSWMSGFAVQKFLERQIVEHSVSVNIDRYPKDFIYGTLRVIYSSAVPDLSDLSNPNNWQASHLISLSSLQMATNVGRQGTLEILSPEMIHAKFRDRFIEKLNEAGKKAMSMTSQFGPTYWNEEINLRGSGYNNKSNNVDSGEQKILPFKQRKPNLPEKDASGTPYWWPRYLMLDLIAEALFIDKDGKEIAGAHIIDITTSQTNDGGDQSVYLVRDKNGRVCEGKIYDFLFWLLEPNVGIGLWPNYWKREFVRCQEQQVDDYTQVGVSDRIVLSNFLKAGNEFLKVKSKINTNPTQNLTTNSNETETKDSTYKSQMATALLDSLTLIALKYGLVSIGSNEVSLWLAETIKSLIDKSKSINNQFEDALKIIKSIKLNDIQYCIDKSFNKSIKNKGSLIPNMSSIKSEKIIDWIATNETYSQRICEITMDSLLSEPLAPLLEISPYSINYSDLIQNTNKTFVVISDKVTLLTHQLYPFISGRGDYPINIVAVHATWLISKSNLTKRAIFYNSHTHSFIEADLNTPLVLDYAYIVELNIDEEIQRHANLTNELESAGLTIINPASISQVRADDKLWIRLNKPANVHIPNYVCLRPQEESDEQSLIKIKSLKTSPTGLVVQPSANTTESIDVHWFDSSTQLEQILTTSKQLNQQSLLLSEYRGNVLYKQAPIVFRFNVSESQISAAAYVAHDSNTKIVGLKSGAYCERLDLVLTNLTDHKMNKVTIDNSNWLQILQTARLVAQQVGLPLVGIDILLEIDNSAIIKPIILEVNARPGTLIFGEELFFNSDGHLTHSTMISPVNEDFWNLIIQLKTSNSTLKCPPQTLLEWKNYLTSQNLANWHATDHSNMNLNNSNLISWFVKRYSLEDPTLIQDRIQCLIKTIDDCIMQTENKFDLNAHVSIIFSNGRDRYFGGHTDLLGLGGPTINATTENEIICIIQKSQDSQVYASNSNRKEFKSSVFSINELLNVLDNHEKESTSIGQWGVELWSPHEWTSYLKGSLVYMLSKEFSANEKVKNSLLYNTGCRVHFNSSGRLELISKVGSSSSSALTSSFVLGLNKIFNLNLNRHELSETDYGEFYLGKTAGISDKTTILNAKKGKIIALASLPDRFMQSLTLPDQIVIIMARSNIPRLNSLKGRDYLLNSNLYTNEQVDSIQQYFNGIMRRFGSFVFVRSVEILIQNLNNQEIYTKVNISQEEADAVLKSLGNDNTTNNKNLLRELCFGGDLEAYLPNYSGWSNRNKRYKLIFKLLKLLPESLQVTIGCNQETIHPRKSTLYGISEVERCHAYLTLMNKLNESKDLKDEKTHLNNLLDLVRWAHDGDRAVKDYRKSFAPTSWATHSRNLVSDQILDTWIDETNNSEELINKPGGFERSLPEFDEWATSLDECFKRQAALRVSAAGLGGTVCVHSLSSISNEVIQWLKAKEFTVRTVHPGPSYDIL